MGRPLPARGARLLEARAAEGALLDLVEEVTGEGLRRRVIEDDRRREPAGRSQADLELPVELEGHQRVHAGLEEPRPRRERRRGVEAHHARDQLLHVRRDGGEAARRRRGADDPRERGLGAASVGLRRDGGAASRTRAAKSSGTRPAASSGA